jgi:hypothetical protein
MRRAILQYCSTASKEEKEKLNFCSVADDDLID